MELRKINRDYNNNYKFFNNYYYNKKQYNILSEDFLQNITFEKANKMKKISFHYFEERLHVITSYIFLLKYILPIIILSLFIFFHKYNLMLLVSGGMILMLLLLIKILKKMHKITCWSYSFEITALNYLLNKEYNTTIDVDFDELGNLYIESISRDSIYNKLVTWVMMKIN